jgi:hypothetical protein
VEGRWREKNSLQATRRAGEEGGYEYGCCRVEAVVEVKYVNEILKARHLQSKSELISIWWHLKLRYNMEAIFVLSSCLLTHQTMNITLLFALYDTPLPTTG